MILDGQKGILYNEMMVLESKIEKQQKICKAAQLRPDRFNPYHENNTLKELQEKYNKIVEEMKSL